MAKRVYTNKDYREALMRWSKTINLDDITTINELDQRLTDEDLYNGAVGGRQTLYERLSKLVKLQGEIQVFESNLQRLRTEFL